ncbi:uncharacterized protein BKA55DRAFT_577725 [Fusarium redolens]|jgi:cytoskeletal protein RodZ|uniref:Cell wall protein n=1 Tax=Fusarium redolens TaxID=48865 RepID=A0A9P9JYN9_FUSRE|nr:uncharacterized protein BKA55DRAFT_577725 [Fusarium redolens]KAH7237540.1 hypothetical protein BKA55DRAFT_577725 [Fusarium redolens]
MRFSKHVLPIAILLTGVIAAKDEESTTAVEKAKATNDKASETTADDSKTADATEEASATATGKDDKKDSKTDKSDTKSATKEKSAASQTTADGPTITWDPPAPKTTVPDINAGSPSPMTPGVLVLSLVLGITSLGMALL